MAINKIFKRFTGSAWEEYKFAAYDSEKLGGVLPSGYALASHSHSIANITGLQTALDGKLSTTGTAVNSDKLDGFDSLEIGERGSLSDFPNGTLVLTSLDASAASGASWTIEVTGKGYGQTPFNFIAEGYNYSGTFINTAGYNYGAPLSYIKVLKYSDGKLAFWWPRTGYWNSFSVKVTETTVVGFRKNYVTSITDSAEPSSDKKVQINLTRVIFEGDSRLSDARTPTSHTLDSHTGSLSISKIAPGTNNYVLKTVGGSVVWAVDDNTTYASGTVSEATDGTETAQRVWSPSILKAAIEALSDTDSNNYLTGVSGSGNGTVTFTRSGLGNLTWDASHTHGATALNVSGISLIGKSTAGAGSTQELAVSTVQSMLGLGSLAYMSSITSAMVTGALGFTPYNATNPNGYITSSGSITGNAATATKLAAPVNINGVSFDGSASITVYDGSKLSLNGGTLQDDLILAKDGSTEVGSHGIVFQANTAGGDFLRELNIDKTGTLKFNGTAVSLLGHNHTYADLTGTIPTWNQNTTGNAATATTAATANAWTTPRTLTIGSSAQSIDGSGNVTYTLAGIGAAATSHTHGDISSTGLISAQTSMGTGDAILLADSSASGKVIKSDITLDTTNTTHFLRRDGAWVAPSMSAPVTSVNGYTGAVNTVNNTITTATVNSLVYGVLQGNAVVQTSSGTRLKIDTGFYNPQGGSTGNSITFNVSFTQRPAVFAFPVRAASTTATLVAAKATAVSTTGATFISSYISSTATYTPSTSSETYCWVAIGY